MYIQDHLIPKSADAKYRALIQVNDVPFFLAEFAALTSTLSYKLTEALEDVTHAVNDSIYNWTGHLYAGDTLFQAGKAKMNNSVVEENFRSYCRECVYRDVEIGLYTKDELKSAPDLLSFLQTHASQLRSVRFRSDSGNVQWVPCSESIQQIKKRFDRARVGGPLTPIQGKAIGNAADILFGEIGNEASFLLSQSAKGQDQIKNLMKQQIAIDLLQEEIPGTLHSFSAKRAERLAQSNERILGAKGVRSIFKMRNFFEGAIYIVFPLILIFSLIPSWGIKALINWLQFVLWVNIWPPFYVAILGQLRVSNELKKQGIFVSPGGVRSIWLRHDLETFKKRLKALEAKSAQENFIYTEEQLAALEKRKENSLWGDRNRTSRVFTCSRYLLHWRVKRGRKDLSTNCDRYV